MRGARLLVKDALLEAFLLSRPAVTVIGAGIVGLAAAHHLHKAGAQVTIVDRDPDGDKASLGNAGAIAVTEVVPAACADSGGGSLDGCSIH